MKKKILVFVYGTLKKGYGNHRLLTTSKFVSKATTADKYLFQDNGSFPYVIDNSLQQSQVREELKHNVIGELYEVTEEVLSSLDSLEGYRKNSSYSLYDRQVVTVVDENNKKIKCNMYVSQRFYPSLKILDSGEWKGRKYE